MIVVITYKGRDNPNSVIFKEDGVAIPFDAATRIVCSFYGSAVVADSDAEPGLFDWSQGGGAIEFSFNDLSVGEGTYAATLIVYDALHTDGQVLTHHTSKDLMFRFVNA